MCTPFSASNIAKDKVDPVESRPKIGQLFEAGRGYLFTIEGVGAVDACNVDRARWLNSIDVRRLLFSCYIQGIVFEKTLNYFNKLGVTEHTYKRYQGLSYVWPRQCTGRIL